MAYELGSVVSIVMIILFCFIQLKTRGLFSREGNERARVS